ncbi:stt-3 [Symbiodinium microadriaticum]|nr:stt-3 [Symbiodinium microadriaticum]
MLLFRWVAAAVIATIQLLMVAYFCLWAYRIRMSPVHDYGYLIHEFDPWFNFRVAQYLSKHGWFKFAKWYDYMSWYPIGRPIGTTTYPGMQFASIWIWNVLKSTPKMDMELPLWFLQSFPKRWRTFLPGHGHMSFGPMKLNDVCVLTPAWFGGFATLFLVLLTIEASESRSAGVAAGMVMAIIPAHMMRSSAGEYDNEAVAVTCFCATFWLWCRSIRTPRSWPWGVLAGLAYFSAAATWGGYIFVNNLIGLHAAVLVALGQYNLGLYLAYTLWYAVGTTGAMLIPVIGWAPLRAMEQMPSLLVFVVFQLLQACDFARHRVKGLASPWKFCLFRVAVFAAAALAGAGVCFTLYRSGHFAPLGARIRGLFLKHKKTGNPLVDSVAEHSATSSQAYAQYLGDARYVAALGLLFCWHQQTPAKLFPVLYAAVAYHFSAKMSRLMIICGPIVSMLAGYPVGIVLEWCFQQFLNMCCAPSPLQPEVKTQPRSGGMGSIYRWLWRYVKPLTLPAEVADFFETSESLHRQFPRPCRATRCTVAMLILAAGYQNMRDPVKNFIATCEEIAPHMGHPSIVFKSRQGLITDYLDGYKWLKANTPSDARVMAWWDYGYQITGIGNRTSIADGNTWNHEHIATLGRTLTNPEKKAHNIMRHLADYVLVWAGGQGDDMGKSPHLARIANSVFPDVCGEDDPTCRKFGFYAGGQPTEMMAASFLYKAVRHNIDEGVRLDGKLFQEVHTTKHGLMRIFKVLGVSEESKKWVADPANRKCDAEGSWYCVGQYPPSLHKLISKRKNFAQLEDFNRKDGEKSAYTRMVAYAHFIRGVDNSCQLASAHSARRLPWVSAALAASCAGIYALVVQKQRWDREAQLMKEADEAELRRARMEAEAAAAATAEAEAQAAQAKAAREDAERIQKAAIAKESQEAQERARKDLERRHAEFAAVAGQCSQLLADLKLVVEATDYVEVAPHTEGLSEFMQQAQAFVDGESFKSLQESSLDGMAELTAQCAYALSAAKDHLAKLSKAQAAERLYEAAAAEMRAERQKWLLGEDVDAHALGSALGRAQDALSELRSCGLEMSLETIDGSQVSAAQSVLSELEEARQKEQGWEQNRQALQSAVAAQDAAACESALKEASSADCPLSAAMALAEEMSLPRQIDISEVAKGMQLAPLSEQSGEVDYVAAAAAASSFVSSSELSDQASSLAKEIATQYVLDKQELAHASQLLLPEWANQCSQKTAQLSRAFAGQKSKQKLQLIQDFQQTAADRRKQAIREAMGEVQDEVEKDIYSLQSAQMQALWAELAQVRGSFDDQLRSLGQAPERLQQLWSSDRSPDAQAKSASLSTLNLLALREASREEHAESTDAFASSVTARVRTELTALGKGSVKEIPTQQELQRSFHDELPKLVAAVFEPRTGLASSFVGRIFGMMYVLRSEQEEASTHAALESRLGQRIPTVAPEDGVHRQNQKNNLRTLALAMHLVDTGRLAEAVDTLDGSLRGPCRSLAHGWMSLARMSLLLQQVEEKMKREEAGWDDHI